MSAAAQPKSGKWTYLQFKLPVQFNLHPSMKARTPRRSSSLSSWERKSCASSSKSMISSCSSTTASSIALCGLPCVATAIGIALSMQPPFCNGNISLILLERGARFRTISFFSEKISFVLYEKVRRLSTVQRDWTWIHIHGYNHVSIVPYDTGILCRETWRRFVGEAADKISATTQLRQ